MIERSYGGFCLYDDNGLRAIRNGRCASWYSDSLMTSYAYHETFARRHINLASGRGELHRAKV